MKTSLIGCVNAYMAVQFLMGQEFPYAAAYTLAELQRGLQPHVDFYIEKENELTQQYGKKDENGNVAFTERGTFLFADKQAGEAYNQKRFQLANVPVELDWAEKTIPEPEKIRPMHLAALQGFLRFGGKET